MPHVKESICQNLKSLIQTITTGNGYNNTIATVERFQMHGNTLIDSPSVQIIQDAENKSPAPNPLYSNVLTVNLVVRTRQQETDTTDTDTYLNSLQSDLEKALMLDVTRGGYAVDNIVRSVEPFILVDEQPEAGFIMSVDIMYRHLQSDPETPA